MTAPAILPLDPTLIEGWHRAIDRVARERCWLASTEAMDWHRFVPWAAGLIARGAPVRLALAGPEVVGWADIQRLGRGARGHVGGLGMGLVPGWRGLGLGARLLDRVLSDACRAGLSRIELQAIAGNTAALALYRRAGFETEGRLRAGWQLDGRTEDLIVMGLTLDGPAPLRAGSGSVISARPA